MRKVGLLFLVLLVTACGATATPTPAPKLAIPWGSGDSAAYVLMAGGQTAGTIVFTTAPGSSGGYVLTTEVTSGAVKDVAKIRVDDTLKPLAGTREISGAGASDFALVTVYDGKGKFSIEAKTAQGTKSAAIDVPTDSWDNDESLFAIRALPLAENYTTTFTLVVGASASVVKTQLTVLGKETTETAAGSFTTYKVEMAIDQTKLYAWYDVQKPHHLIQYQSTVKATSGDVTQTIQLTKIGN
jgi:hypothetical protein